MKYTRVVIHQNNETIYDNVSFKSWADLHSYLSKEFGRVTWVADEEFKVSNGKCELIAHIYLIGDDEE